MLAAGALTTAREPPQQCQLAVEQPPRLRALDGPAPRVCEIERAADLARAAVRDVEEPPRIAPVTAVSFGEVEHDAARSARDLIGGIGAVLAKLCDHGAKGSNQIQRDVIGNQHVYSCVMCFKKETPPADDLRGGATPVATDPRQDP